MLFALIAIDKAGALETRLANRDAHLQYVRDTGIVRQAGPFLDADGGMCGSLLIIEATEIAEVEAWAESDPYALAGLFESVTIRPWKRVIG